MWLPNAIIEDVKETVEVFYVSYATTRYWAENRAKGEPLVFSGWYWAKGPREGGPFKSQSACYRDAWFRICQKRTPPVLHQEALKAERKQKRENSQAAQTAPVRLRAVA
jgi:hypothetical protein